MAGQLAPDEGNVNCDSSRYYVPQIDLTIQLTETHVFEYIQERHENWW